MEDFKSKRTIYRINMKNTSIGNSSLLFCPVCGCPTEEYDEFITFGGTCPCCAYEFGIDDSNFDNNPFMKYRTWWFKNGLKFMSSSEKANWSLEQAFLYLKNFKKLDLKNYFLFDKVDNSQWINEFDENEIMKYWVKRKIIDE